MRLPMTGVRQAASRLFIRKAATRGQLKAMDGPGASGIAKGRRTDSRGEKGVRAPTDALALCTGKGEE